MSFTAHSRLAHCAGLQQWNYRFDGVNSPLPAHQVTVYAGGGHRYVTNTAPDASFTLAHYLNGQLLSREQRDANNSLLGRTSYAYDAHGRMSSSTDERNGTTSYTCNDADQIVTTTSPVPGNGPSAQTTMFSYDDMGRRLRTLLPDGASVTNQYDAQGHLLSSSGARTYPAGYMFDNQGRLKTLTTWQNASNTNTAATTTWNYDPYRGWLTSKNK